MGKYVCQSKRSKDITGWGKPREDLMGPGKTRNTLDKTKPRMTESRMNNIKTWIPSKVIKAIKMTFANLDDKQSWDQTRSWVRYHLPPQGGGLWTYPQTSGEDPSSRHKERFTPPRRWMAGLTRKSRPLWLRLLLADTALTRIIIINNMGTIIFDIQRFSVSIFLQNSSLQAIKCLTIVIMRWSMKNVFGHAQMGLPLSPSS